MNTNLLSIVKQIIADTGEAILADPARLKAFFSDLAKDEPKPLRIAFGRCIESGAYDALKSAPDAAERALRKTSIAQKVLDEYGLDVTLCAEALDILEAALFEPDAVEQTSESAPEISQPESQPAPVQPDIQAAPAPSTPESGQEKTRRQNQIIAALAIAWIITVIISLGAYQDQQQRFTAELAEAALKATERENTARREAGESAEQARLEEAQQADRRGDEYYNSKSWDLAIEKYTEAIALDPKNAIYYSDRGSAYYYGKKNDRKALDDYTRAHQLAPYIAEYYNQMGHAYYSLGNYTRAIENYTEALRLDPNNQVIKNNLADARRARGW